MLVNNLYHKYVRFIKPILVEKYIFINIIDKRLFRKQVWTMGIQYVDKKCTEALHHVDGRLL